MECRFHCSFTTLHNLGNLFDGKVGVIAEHDCQTLTGCQLPKCGHDRQLRGDACGMVSAFRFQWIGRRRAITAALLSPCLSYRDDKDPCRRPIKPRYNVPLSEGSGECFLGSVLRIEAVTHREPQGAADAGILNLKELLKRFVRRSRHHLTRDRGTTRSKRLVTTKYRAIPEPRRTARWVARRARAAGRSASGWVRSRGTISGTPAGGTGPAPTITASRSSYGPSSLALRVPRTFDVPAFGGALDVLFRTPPIAPESAYRVVKPLQNAAPERQSLPSWRSAERHIRCARVFQASSALGGMRHA